MVGGRRTEHRSDTDIPVISPPPAPPLPAPGPIDVAHQSQTMLTDVQKALLEKELGILDRISELTTEMGTLAIDIENCTPEVAAKRHNRIMEIDSILEKLHQQLPDSLTPTA